MRSLYRANGNPTRGQKLVDMALCLAIALAVTIGLGPHAKAAVVPPLPAAGSYFQVGTFVEDVTNRAYAIDSNTVRRLGMFQVPVTGPSAWHIVQTGQFRQFFRTRWGWVTGTIYFDKRETQLATSTAFLSFAAAFLPPPFNFLIGGELAWISTTAGIARSQGGCLMIKSHGAPLVYFGKWCR